MKLNSSQLRHLGEVFTDVPKYVIGISIFMYFVFPEKLNSDQPWWHFVIWVAVLIAMAVFGFSLFALASKREKEEESAIAAEDKV